MLWLLLLPCGAPLAGVVQVYVWGWNQRSTLGHPFRGEEPAQGGASPAWVRTHACPPLSHPSPGFGALGAARAWETRSLHC